jgi:hypothetical protein
MSVPFLYDSVQTTVIAPQPVVPVGNPNLPSFMVGTGSWGKTNSPIPFSSATGLYDAIGTIAQNGSDLATHGTQYILACQAMGKKPNAFLIRISDGTDVAATTTVQDAQGTPGNVLVLTAINTGTRGNSGTATVSQNAQYTTAKPIYDITLTISNAQPEVFQGIVAYATTNYDAPTFVAKARAAINSGLNLSRGPSNYWVASAPGSQSTFAPSVASFAASATGTNGISAITSASYVGTNGTTKTGMYAGTGLGCGQFILCGNNDPTIAPTLAAFGVATTCFAIGPAFPQNTSTAAAITSKQTNNFNAVGSAAIIDFVQWYDPTIGQIRSLSPESNILGVVGSTSPEQNPGNLPQYGLPHLSSTDRTISTNYNPRSGVEASQATQAGIVWIGPMNRNPSFLGLANGQNASGVAGQDGINYPRLTNYLQTVLPTVVGSFVDALQGQDKNDSTRRGVRNTLNNFFAQMKANRMIDSYQVICDNSNNTAITIPAGQLNVSIAVRYLAAARFINLNLQGGVSVTISNAPGLPTEA